MRTDAQRYFTITALPGHADLQQAVAGAAPGYWAGLSPLDRFFVVECLPELVAAHPSEEVAAAYSAAVAALPAEWWSLDETSKAFCTSRMVAVPGIEQQLKTLLTDQTPLTLARRPQAKRADDLPFEVRDMAGAIMLVIHHLVSDGWSMEMILEEARNQYGHLLD